MKNKFSPIRNQARSAFTLTELLVLLVVVCLVGAFVMPPIYRTRLKMNESAAKEVLQMLGSAQVTWKQETGSWARLSGIAYAPGPPSDLEPFMPFLHASELGVAHLGGYKFRQTLDAHGIPTGCVAAPITPGFSGKNSFTLDYKTQAIAE
jgi:type II secretory pathway pseudopilin PulG